MASSTERRDKGKAPAQGYSQDKRLRARQSFVMHEGASSGVKPSRSTSLQEFVLAEVTYSSGDMIIALQESNNTAWINTINKWKNNNNTYTYTTSKWIIMASSAERRDKGKAPT